MATSNDSTMEQPISDYEYYPDNWTPLPVPHEGFWVRGQLNQKPVVAIINTALRKSVLPAQMVWEYQLAFWPTYSDGDKEAVRHLTNTPNTPILGKALLTNLLISYNGKLCLNFCAVAACIALKDTVYLGLDFLASIGPANLCIDYNLRCQLINLNGTLIYGDRNDNTANGDTQLAWAEVTTDTYVPGMSSGHYRIKTWPRNAHVQPGQGQLLYFYPSWDQLCKYPLIVLEGLISINEEGTIRLRITNPTVQAVKLPQHTKIGFIYSVCRTDSQPQPFYWSLCTVCGGRGHDGASCRQRSADQRQPTDDNNFFDSPLSRQQQQQSIAAESAVELDTIRRLHQLQHEQQEREQPMEQPLSQTLSHKRQREHAPPHQTSQHQQLEQRPPQVPQPEQQAEDEELPQEQQTEQAREENQQNCDASTSAPITDIYTARSLATVDPVQRQESRPHRSDQVRARPTTAEAAFSPIYSSHGGAKWNAMLKAGMIPHRQMNKAVALPPPPPPSPVETNQQKAILDQQFNPKMRNRVQVEGQMMRVRIEQRDGKTTEDWYWKAKIDISFDNHDIIDR